MKMKSLQRSTFRLLRNEMVWKKDFI
jgi:hypothetical protein